MAQSLKALKAFSSLHRVTEFLSDVTNQSKVIRKTHYDSSLWSNTLPSKRALSQTSSVIALTLVNGTVLEDELVDEL